MPPVHVSPMTLKRIHREVADLKKEDLGAIKLAPSDDDLFHWNASIPGPEGSVYEGGVFEVEITLGHDYPFSAPRMAFKTRIYHMNINERGGICIDILKHNWSPALSLFKVILSLSSLLTDPNPKDPLVPTIATEYIRNRVQHDQNARRWTILYARPSATAKGKAPALDDAVPSARSSVAPTTYWPSSRPESDRPAPSRTMTPRTATPTETITIEDSGDERPAVARLGTRNAQRSKRKRDVDLNAIDIDLSGEGDEEVVARPSRRQRVAASGTSTGSGANEVIVIED
ncbi:ubiquitin-conjugating enzyme/RWD-like protein [Trametes gibbosa]|nr:ubiquitin-conjugating enzyme/RWD-like protein [Trametes gibbosa]